MPDRNRSGQPRAAGPARRSGRLPVVVHLSSVHGPGDTRIWLKECRSLAAWGYAVAFAVPGAADSVRDGVEILSVPAPGSRRQRMLRTAWQVCRRAERRGADLVHLHDPELMPIAWYLKLKGRRVIIDVHENVPRQVLDKTWINPVLRQPIAAGVAAMETLTAGVADAVIAATPSIAERFPAAKTVLVQNFPIIGELEPPQSARPYADRPPHIAYVGAITAIRGAREMVRAMALLDPALDARLRLAGSFDPPGLARDLGREPGWRAVDPLGQLDRSDVGRLLSETRCGLVLFQPAPNHLEAQPNKLFEYMSAGLPVIASDFPAWRDLVEGAGVGLVVNPREPQEIAAAITWVLEHSEEADRMGRRAKDAVRQRFNWDREAEKLAACYRRVLR